MAASYSRNQARIYAWSTFYSRTQFLEKITKSVIHPNINQGVKDRIFEIYGVITSSPIQVSQTQEAAGCDRPQICPGIPGYPLAQWAYHILQTRGIYHIGEECPGTTRIFPVGVDGQKLEPWANRTTHTNKALPRRCCLKSGGIWCDIFCSYSNQPCCGLLEKEVAQNRRRP